MRKFTSLLLLGFALGSFAQTPGGVSGSELWFKTAPLNSDLQGYYRWQDFSGDSIRLMLLDSRGVKSELTLPNSSGLSLKPWGIALKFLFLHHENILFPND